MPTPQLVKDEYGLYVDPNGNCEDEPGFSTSLPQVQALPSTDPNYIEDINDDTADDDDPFSATELTARYRMRACRQDQLQNMITTWEQAQQQWKNNQREQAILTMLGYWAIRQLFW
jgi:hypothetical protein